MLNLQYKSQQKKIESYLRRMNKELVIQVGKMSEAAWQTSHRLNIDDWIGTLRIPSKLPEISTNAQNQIPLP